MKKRFSTLLCLLLVAYTFGGALPAVAAAVTAWYRDTDGSYGNGESYVDPRTKPSMSVGESCKFTAMPPNGARAGEWWVYSASPLKGGAQERKVGEGASVTYTMQADDLHGTAPAQTAVLVLHLVKTYAVTANVNPAAAGTVTITGTNTGDGRVDKGASVTLTATANSGYAFDHWEGDAAGTENQVVISGVSKDVSCTAVFRELAIVRPTVTTSFTYDGTPKICATAGDHYTVSENEKTSAGTYTFKATPQDGYHWTDGSTDPYEVQWTISKAENTFTQQPTIAGWTYGDSAKAPTATAKFSGTSGITYSYYDSSQGLLDDKPSDAGTYYLKATTPNATDYVSVTSDFVRFEIAPREINTDNISFEDKTDTYDGTQKKIVVPNVPDTVTVTYEDNTRTEAGSQTATANFSPKNANYTVSTKSKTATLTVNQATVSSFSLVASSVTYDGNPHQPVVSSVSTANGKTFTDASIGWTVSYDREDFVNAGEIKVTVTGNKNLAGSASSPQTFTINRARTAELSVTPTSLTYNGQPQGPALTLTHCAEDAASDHEKTEPGTYYVRATPTANYAWTDGSTSSKSVSWTISYQKVTVSFDLNYEGASVPSSSELNYMKGYTLPTPSRTGYDFKGWWTDGEGGTEVTTSTKVERSDAHTLYAHWKAKEYTLTINMDKDVRYEGNESPYTLPITLVYDATNLNELAVVSKSGYRFMGYYLPSGAQLYDAEGHNVRDASAQYWSEAYPTGVYRHDGNLSVTARFSEPLVMCDVMTDVSPASAGTVTGGGTYEKGSNVVLTATANTGYSFAYWLKDEQVLTDNPLKFPAAADVTCTAVFTGNVYTVTLKETQTMPTPTIYVTYGSAYGKFPQFTYQGYTLDGWWTSDDEETRERVDENTIVATAKNHNLYANWVEKTEFTVTWRDPQQDPNKKNDDVVQPTVSKNTEITVAPEATKTWDEKWQHEAWIAGWDPPLPQTVTGDLTFTAVTETIGTVLDCPELTFQRNDNWQVCTNEWHKGQSCLRLAPLLGENTVTLSPLEPGLLKFWWKGGAGTTLLVNGNKLRQCVNRAGDWQEETVEVADSETVSITCEYQQFNGFARLIDDFTWIPNGKITRMIRIESDGHGTATPPSGSYDSGSPVALNAEPNPGYAFCCWTNDTGIVTNVSSWTFTVAEDVYYVASFTACQYSVTFDAAGGLASFTNMLVTYDQPYGKLPTCIRYGYAFAGWFTEGGAMVDEMTPMRFAGAQTLVAHWTPNTYTVTLDADGGSLEGTAATVTFGEKYTLPTPTKDGWTFVGWYDSANQRVDTNTRVQKAVNQTLKAQWVLTVGILSEALDCTNLKFEQEGGWEITTDEKWKAADGRCVATSNLNATLSAEISESGTLSIIWKGKATGGLMTVEAMTNGESVSQMTVNNFTPDEWQTNDVPIIVADEPMVFAVRCTSLKVRGTDEIAFAIDTVTWTPDVPPTPVGPVVTNEVPEAVEELVYDGTAKTGVRVGDNYELFNAVATNAGEYVATATVTNGVWEGGSSAPTNITWRIAKAPVDTNGVMFADETYVADGRAKNIYVSGDIPSGVTDVTYVGNGQTVPGTYEVTAMFTVDANHLAVENMTATLTIEAPAVTNVVPKAETGLVYNGGAQTGVVEGANYTIVGNVATNAGTYTAVATVTNGVWEGGAFEPTNVTWTIAKAPAPDVSGVTFESATFEYDGASHSIAVSGTVPAGVEVVYEGETNRTEVGTNTVTAIFKVLDAVNYEAITNQLTATLAITAKEEPPVPPKPIVTNAVPEAVTGLVYDGTEKTGVAAGANYTIVGNVATNAGDYVATATVTNGVWEGGATGETNVTWTIAKAPAPDVSGVTFVDATYEYDGASHSIAVSGTVPSGVEVVYTGDATNRTEVGTNTVTASFRVLDTNNYEAITTTLTAKLIITAKEEPPVPPEPVTTNAVPTAIAGLVYNGDAQTGVAAGANYTIVGNVATNAGDYTAVATVTNGVWEGGATGETNVTWTITKAPAPDVSGVTFVDATFEYDGTSHTIAVSGSVPAGVEVVYTGDATNRTEVGTNTVVAGFKVLDTNNYEAVTNVLTAKLVITAKEEPPPTPPEPVVTNAVPTAVTGLVYNGGAQTGVAEDANYTIVGNVATNAGEYVATATVTNGVWEGGSSAPTNVTWTIAKAPAPDVSGVTFDDATYEYDGASHSIAVSGTVPAGVEVVYEGETNRTEVGTNTVTASFRVLDTNNYEAITTTLTAKLVITAKEEPPVPPEPVVTNAVPVAVQGLIYDGTAKVGVLEGLNYVLTGNVATNAGMYVATATLTNGVWTGGSSEPTNIVWTIAPRPAETGRLYYPQQLGAFASDAAVTYSGWLRDPQTGAIVAALQVKTTKAKGGKPSKSTISVTPVGGKKKTYKAEIMPGGNPTDVFGIVYGAQGLSGSVQGFVGVPDGATVEAAKDFAKAKNIRADEIPQGCRTLSLRVAGGGRDSFSVTVDKKGKAKVAGQLAEGVSMSQSVLGSLGQDAFAVPISYSKKITSKATGEKRQVTFAFVLWISSGKAWISDAQGARWTDGEVIGQRPVERPADALYEIGFVLPEGYLAAAADGNRLSPTGEVVQVLGKKWITEKTSGSVKYDADTDMVYVKPSASRAPANLSKLKLTYTEKKGTVKGSFKLYYRLSGKLKSDSATVTGVAVDGAFVGNVVIRKKGPPVLIDWKQCALP